MKKLQVPSSLSESLEDSPNMKEQPELSTSLPEGRPKKQRKHSWSRYPRDSRTPRPPSTSLVTLVGNAFLVFDQHCSWFKGNILSNSTDELFTIYGTKQKQRRKFIPNANLWLRSYSCSPLSEGGSIDSNISSIESAEGLDNSVRQTRFSDILDIPSSMDVNSAEVCNSLDKLQISDKKNYKLKAEHGLTIVNSIESMSSEGMSTACSAASIEACEPLDPLITLEEDVEEDDGFIMFNATLMEHETCQKHNLEAVWCSVDDEQCHIKSSDIEFKSDIQLKGTAADRALVNNFGPSFKEKNLDVYQGNIKITYKEVQYIVTPPDENSRWYL